MKYTDEQLREAVGKASSFLGAMRVLGLGGSGGSHAHIKRRIKLADIDTSHFLGRSHSKGQRSWNRKTSSEVLVVNPPGSKRTQSYRLRNSLADKGRIYVCECCGISEWQGKKLTLQVDHKNGDWLDNTEENLRFLCPNCHSQTPNWCGKKVG